MSNPSLPGFEGRTTPPERRDFFDVRRVIRERMRWSGDWLSNNPKYDWNDVVRDDDWTMVCINPYGCTTKPAPTPVGDPFYVYGLTAAQTAQVTVNQLITGNRWTFGTGGYITGYRLWTVAGNSYAVFSYNISTEQLSPILPTFTATSDGWTEYSIADTLVPAGTDFGLVVVQGQPDPSPVVFSGNWDYDTPNNPVAPLSGQIVHANTAPSEFRVHKTDNDGGDRSAALAAMSIGDTIAGASLTWAIQSISDEGTWINFAVAPTSQGFPDGIQNFDFTTTAPTPVTHFKHVDYWTTPPASGAVKGWYSETGMGNIVEDDHQYGVDIRIQEASVSDEWEVVASPSGGGSGGGTGIPDGGTLGQLIRKDSAADGDASWDFQVVEGSVASPPADLGAGQLLYDPSAVGSPEGEVIEQSGIVSVPANPGNAFSQLAVTYSTPFPAGSSPVVTLTVQSQANYFAEVDNTLEDGFLITIRNAGGGSITSPRPVHWRASLPGVQRSGPGGSFEATAVPYTPALQALTTNPNIGSGATAVGWYRRVGDMVEAWGRIAFGSGGSGGSGTYRIKLPTFIDASKITVSGSGGAGDIIGQAWAFQGGGSNYYGLVQAADNSDSGRGLMFLGQSALNATTNTNPFTWGGSGDTLIWKVSYPTL